MGELVWSSELVQKYNLHGPRYTSYPTALSLHSDFPVSSLQSALVNGPDKLSLYLHIPFCHQLCYYCGCTKEVTRHQFKADGYLDALEQEIALYAPWLTQKKIDAVHLGGGTPTFLTQEQLSRLAGMLRAQLPLEKKGQWSIEIDPRSCDSSKLAHLFTLGFRRVSFGVQDFASDVQLAINRVQPYAMVEALVHQAQQLGFHSVNLDLVYGLPYQRQQSFAKTLTKVIALNPDRVSLFSYAHLPARFASQRKIPTDQLPGAEEKLALLQLAIKRLNDAGYVAIGMDHFAKPTDALSLAQQEGTLQRNFQGYTTHGQDALIGLGMSSISQVSGVMWQNHKDRSRYQAALTEGRWPLERGFSSSQDDKLRAALISQLICHFELDIQEFSLAWQLDSFWDYFAKSRQQLEPLVQDGLVELTQTHLKVTALGRLLVRLVCACFDRYLQLAVHTNFSKVV